MSNAIKSKVSHGYIFINELNHDLPTALLMFSLRHHVFLPTRPVHPSMIDRAVRVHPHQRVLPGFAILLESMDRSVV